MNELRTGEYFGHHTHTLQGDSFLITDTEYTHARVDWHRHEHPYFTYLIAGKLFEGNKKENYHLGQGSLLFHNWEDAHYNIKPPGYTRGFHIELSGEWFRRYELSPLGFEGSMQLQSPLQKARMNQIFLTSKITDVHRQTSIDMLLLEMFAELQKDRVTWQAQPPAWVKTLQAQMREAPDSCGSLREMAADLGIHPVHLSRGFSKYFHTTFGEYIRREKVNRAALLVVNSKDSLTEIGMRCGFYDQSHFTSHFKRIFGITPLKFRKEVRQG